MSKKKEKWLRFCRRNNSHRGMIGTWCAHVSIDKGGEGGELASTKIYFKALDGELAKCKALPKIQSFLAKNWIEEGSPPVRTLLEQVKKTHVAQSSPVYVLRARYSFYRSLLHARKPSMVFKVQSGHSGGNGH